MTVMMPETVKSQGNASIIFVPTLADPTAPTVAELTAADALNITCFLYDDFSVTGSENKGEGPRKMCSHSVPEQFGARTIEVADLQYSFVPQAPPDDPGNAARTALADGTRGYIVERLGIDGRDAEVNDGDRCNVYRIQLGIQNVTRTGDGEYDEFSITQTAVMDSGDEPIYDVVIGGAGS